MYEPMIDREDVVERLLQLLTPTAHARFVRLLGDGKMGKTHLLTKVLPALAEQHNTRVVVLDLRNQVQTPLDLLHVACSQLGHAHFREYDQAYKEWLNRPQIQVTGLQAMLSIISARSRTGEDDQQRIAPHLTRCFVEDLQNLNQHPILMIFDQADNATEPTQAWLVDSLLVQLYPLSHVSAVIGGRTLPEPHGSYARICESYELRPVENEDAYIRWCRAVAVPLTEEPIRVLAKVLNYAPGAFAETIKVHYPPQGAIHG